MINIFHHLSSPYSKNDKFGSVDFTLNIDPFEVFKIPFDHRQACNLMCEKNKRSRQQCAIYTQRCNLLQCTLDTVFLIAKCYNF